MQLVVLQTQGATASESLLNVRVSPGKAFIKGYEVEKLAKQI